MLYKAGRVRRIVVVASVVGLAALLLQLVPSASGAKSLAAPSFSSKDTAKAKQGKPLKFTIKTRGNPAATVSVTSASLPPGVTFVAGAKGTATLTDPTPLGGEYTIDLEASNGVGSPATQTLTLDVTSKLPLVRHVFVIMMENEDYSATFGTPSADPYLATTLPADGALL